MAASDEVGRVLKRHAALQLGTNDRDVGEGSVRVGRYVGTAGVVITLKAVALRLVGNFCITNYQTILYGTAVTVVGIEVIIPTMEGYEVLAVYRAAKPLEGVVA